MKKAISKNRSTGRILSVIIILSGISLMTYMIKVEDEPGALPLLLIVSGTIWFFINRYQIKKQLH